LSVSGDLVLDASAITTYLIEQASRDKVYRVMRGSLDRGAKLFTADLAYVEVANALWRACALRGLIEEEGVNESLGNLYGLPLEAVRQEGGLVKRAVEISLESGLSVYDSMYVSVAEREKAAVFTFDEKQYRVAGKYVHAYTGETPP